MKTVAKGDKIKVDYTGTFDDGTVFDASEKHGQPLEFEVGSGQVIKGFDDAVIGMKEGQEKKMVIPPAEAYGEVKAELRKKVPRKQLPPDQEPKVGMILGEFDTFKKHNRDFQLETVRGRYIIYSNSLKTVDF